MKTLRLTFLPSLALCAVLASGLSVVSAQETKSAPVSTKKADPAAAFDKPQAPATLPGNGLAQHDFLIVAHLAARDNKGVQLVKGGKVVWSYSDPTGAQGPYSDATLLPNGNILFAHGYGVRIVSPDKKIVWRYDVKSDEHEIHGAQPIGTDRVIFLQNGQPTGKIVVANIVTGKIEKEIEIPVAATANLKEPRYVHMQMRRLRLTPAGTVLVAYTNANVVIEFDENGKQIWSATVDSPWSVERLKNGNTLVNSLKNDVIEFNPKGEAVWKFSRVDAAAQGYVVGKTHVAHRLANGNTLLTVNNETAWHPGLTPDLWAPVQAIEISPDKKIVWALRSWSGDTNLGPATTIQFLDDPILKEKLHFGSFK